MFVHEIINGADPSHIAIEGEGEFTYGELAELVHLYRNSLYEMGIREGMKVGLYSANRPEFILRTWRSSVWAPSLFLSITPWWTGKWTIS